MQVTYRLRSGRTASPPRWLIPGISIAGPTIRIKRISTTRPGIDERIIPWTVDWETKSKAGARKPQARRKRSGARQPITPSRRPKGSTSNKKGSSTRLRGRSRTPLRHLRAMREFLIAAIRQRVVAIR
jgi:hypothetical protein